MNTFFEIMNSISRGFFSHHETVVPFLAGDFLGLWLRGALIGSTGVPVPNAFICFVAGGIIGIAFWKQIYVDAFSDRNRKE